MQASTTTPPATGAGTAPAPGAPPDAPAAPRANVPLLALLALTHVVVDAYATTVPALLPFWQARFGLTYGLAGLITGIANVTSSVAQPLVGILTDRGRNPRWIALSCLVAAAGISSTGLAGAFPLFLLLVVAGGLGVSGFHPQGYKLTGQYAGRKQAIATSWFLVGGNVGVAVGPLLGTAVALRFGTQGTPLLAIPGVLFAAALFWVLPRWSRRASAGTAASGRARAAETVAPPEIAGLPWARRLPAIGVLVATVALRSAFSNSLTSFIPLYFVRVAGSGEAVASRVLSGMLFLGALATIAGGYLADRFGRLRVLSATLLVAAPLHLLFLALPAGSAGSVAALWAAGATITGSFSITVVLAQELWFERRALASGVIVGFAFGIGGLMVPLAGTLADRVGLPTALRTLAALPLLALLLVGVLAFLLRRPRQA